MHLDQSVAEVEAVDYGGQNDDDEGQNKEDEYQQIIKKSKLLVILLQANYFLLNQFVLLRMIP